MSWSRPVRSLNLQHEKSILGFADPVFTSFPLFKFAINQDFCDLNSQHCEYHAGVLVYARRGDRTLPFCRHQDGLTDEEKRIIKHVQVDETFKHQLGIYFHFATASDWLDLLFTDQLTLCSIFRSCLEEQSARRCTADIDLTKCGGSCAVRMQRNHANCKF